MSVDLSEEISQDAESSRDSVKSGSELSSTSKEAINGDVRKVIPGSPVPTDSVMQSPNSKREASPAGNESPVKRSRSQDDQSAVESPMNVDEITPLKEEDGSEEKEEEQQEPESEDKVEKPIVNQHVKRLPSADVPDLMSPQTNQNLPVQVMSNKNIRLKLK